MENYIQLDRNFSVVSKDLDYNYKESWSSFLGSSNNTDWKDVIKEFRCVILAEAGAGKTEELKQQAYLLESQRLFSFFIRIEDIDSNFEESFEVGSQDDFNQWMASSDEAWFFLDSVDEARLNNANAFKKAITKFSGRIDKAKHRAHIIISSRPYSWRPLEDRKLLNEKLPLPNIKKDDETHSKSDAQQNDFSDSLKVWALRPLDRERIKQYCCARGTKKTEELINEIDRLNLWSLAERPFDLETIIDKWNEDYLLNSRLELLRHNMSVKLTEKHSAGRAEFQTLTLKTALDGARRLAAAVVLSGKAGISISGAAPNQKNLDASDVLIDWSPQDIKSLLELGVFNDIVYDAVRFRHREVRELLAAEWFDTMLQSGADKYSIKALFFREQYGERIITPTVRPVLTWLVLFNADIYQDAIAISPKITVEGGDPSVLPLLIREDLLEKIVLDIVNNRDHGGANDNTAIARIARLDLTPKAISLINQFNNNDDAIFFLGRLAWQGKMFDTLHLFESIVLNSNRSIYARIASLRAIVTVGEQKYCSKMWTRLNSLKSEFEHKLLAEFLHDLPPSIENSQQLFISIKNLKSDAKKEDYSGLRRALSKYLGKLSVENNSQHSNYLLNEFQGLLNQSPFENTRHCQVSKKYKWLLGNAAQLLEKLVKLKCDSALNSSAITILLSLMEFREWRGQGYDEYKDKLEQLVPAWPELNDTLYWASISHARAKLRPKDRPLTDDYGIYNRYLFWEIDETSYKRLLDKLQTLEFSDDQLVALNTVIRVYLQSDKPPEIFDDIKASVKGSRILTETLQTSLGPKVVTKSEYDCEYEAEQKIQDAKKSKRKKTRLKWIESLRGNPQKTCENIDLKSGKLTNNLWWLYSEIEDDDSKQNLARGFEWQKLVPVFGSEVAVQYKNAIMDFWRYYKVELQSEHSEYNNQISASQMVAMAGLEVESRDTATFPQHLSNDELQQCLRYLAKELNGFPSWLESIYKACPDLALHAVKTELFWELNHTTPDNNLSYILHDLFYYAPWLHQPITPIIFDWMLEYPDKIVAFPQLCVQIMISGGISKENLINLCKREIDRTQLNATKAKWFAIWVDCDAEVAIPVISLWLKKLDKEGAIASAANFIISLVGDRRGRNSIGGFGTFVTPRHLKELFILIHKYIKSEDDINRAGKGVYTPNYRDDAQDARSCLFSMLSHISGNESYIVMKELEKEHPVPSHRPWMAIQAYKHAESDGDLEPWTGEQVVQFERNQLITPRTHKQLFQLGVLKLNSMKAWLERGNDSNWKTWQRAEDENEVRNLVASWLNQNCQQQYTTAQEPELANSQRMDIWLNSNFVNAPVPIELKLLDKSWSGNKLCERLRNQLVGDYLRAEGASCGVMLLVSANSNKKWIINNKRVSLVQLAGALDDYWDSIASSYPNVDAIDVIVIDLNLRSKVSTT
jgi:hypothetical protein